MRVYVCTGEIILYTKHIHNIVFLSSPVNLTKEKYFYISLVMEIFIDPITTGVQEGPGVGVRG